MRRRNLHRRRRRRYGRSALASKVIIQILLVAAGLNLIFGVFFYWAESQAQPELTLFDSIWWAMVTMTTVGYGDFYPQTFVGRFLVAYGTIFLGVGVISYMAGSIVESVILQVNRRRYGHLKIKFSNHILICNYSSQQQIVKIIEELRASVLGEKRHLVLVSDSIKMLPTELDELGLHFVYGDPGHVEILKKAGLERCHGVFILPEIEGRNESDNRSFVISATINHFCEQREMNLKVIAMIVNDNNRETMLRSGADAVVSPEGLKDGLMVQEFLYPGLQDALRQLLSNQVGCQLYVLSTRLVGISIGHLRQAAAQNSFNVQILGLRRCQDGETVSLLNPPLKTILGQDDQLIVLADHPHDFYKLEKALL